jgi:hypothetical protein
MSQSIVQASFQNHMHLYGSNTSLEFTTSVFGSAYDSLLYDSLLAGLILN